MGSNMGNILPRVGAAVSFYPSAGRGIAIGKVCGGGVEGGDR